MSSAQRHHMKQVTVVDKVFHLTTSLEKPICRMYVVYH